MPGISFGGVHNIYRNNIVSFGPHNCFHGGGNDGWSAANCTFEGNILSDCTFETADTGAFYTCGQQATAFTNRGNVLRNNVFVRARNTMGTGVQKASNQAVYLDDQMSGWTIENNSFIDCQVGSFIGGGRRNIVRHNNYVKCDTAQHIDNRGMNWEKGSDTCNDVSPPFKTTCNPGAAQWMITKGPASALWRKLWPELEQIQQDHLGLPARNVIANNTFCDCGRFLDVSDETAAGWFTKVAGNVETKNCT
mmetsp:Transcript_24813/g.44146  ORF Transcript_24813/g.44146 Transcript_24813/m.44146 type:complete len:250 (-) Transcript_24813:370-1119(-)